MARPRFAAACGLLAVCLFAPFPPALVASEAGDSSKVEIQGPPPPVAPAVVSRDAEGRVTLRAVRLNQPLTLDGRLDEEVYSRVPAVSQFIQQEPHEGEPATENTEAWVFFDDESLYVAARCWDSQPERMVANEMRRDHFDITRNESFTLVLDTFYDRRNGYYFQTNPLGAIRDQSATDEGNGVNTDWNTVWDVKSSRFDEGWALEMVIPFKSLRYRRAASQVWGINLRRTVRWKNERSHLTPIAASYQWKGVYRFSEAATLVGLEAPLQSRTLELKPFGISSLTTDLNATPAYSNDPTADVGLDLKYGLTRGITADFTLNTDFAQVEEDQQQVNLTRFSLFFPEKREFFLEGQGIFAFAGVELRGAPLAEPDDENPNLTPILFFSRRIGLSQDGIVPIVAGGRVTGRAGQYRIGALSIGTRESATGLVPPTNFSVLRLRRDILRRSDIGLLATHRTRSLEAPSGSNSVLGFDANLAFYQNLKIHTYYARSWTPDLHGSSEGQDSYLTKLDYAADRYGLLLEHLLVGERFNPEVGFVRREAFRRSFAYARFSPRPSSIDAIRRLVWDADVDYITDVEGRPETRRLRAAFRAELENGDEAALEYGRNYERLAEGFEISEGMVIPVGEYRFQDLRAIYQFGSQRAVPCFIIVRRGSFFSGDRTGFSYNGRVELSPRFSLEPRFEVNWVSLAEGDFTDKLASARINFTFTPRMALSSLIQYNSGSGSLSSSVRFRWEYQPGSDLFVVYSEGRETDHRGFPELANRTLAIKLTRLFRH